MIDEDDEVRETTRIPMAGIHAELSVAEPTEPFMTGPHGVSVTQAIRVRRSQNRRSTHRLRQFAPRSVDVPPWRDAAFPTAITLLFSGPTAFRWMRDGKVAAGILMTLGVAGATFALVSLISRGLDRSPNSG